MSQKGFIFDINKCTGCSACQLACTIENQVTPQVVWRRIATFNPARVPGLPVFHHSHACYHCVDAPCMTSCPSSAISKHPGTGAVTIDDSKCIGCRYCSWACPFDAPQYNPAAGLMEKCTFCEERLESGLEPACVALCPTGALGFGEYKSGTGKRPVPGFPSNGVEPAIEFVPLDERRGAPETATESGGGSGLEIRSPFGDVTETPSKISLRSEWTLVVFSLAAAALVGVFSGGGVGTPLIGPVAFGAAGLVTMMVSTLHLGRRGRALRACLNVGRSWLSREIVLFPAFLVLGAWTLAMGFPPWPAVLTGFAALFSVDRVYRVTGTQGLGWHSAGAVGTGFLFAAMACGGEAIWVAFAILALKGLSYAKRKLSKGEARRFVSAVRLTVGCALPMALVWMGEGLIGAVAVMCVVVGEAIDRCEFYKELRFQTPESEMRLELARRLSQSKKAG